MISDDISKSYKKSGLVLFVSFLLSILAIILVDVVFSMLLSKINQELNSEHDRLLISEVTINKLQEVELNLQQMATSIGNRAYALHKQKALESIQEIRHNLTSLKQGGVVQQVIYLNLEQADYFKKNITLLSSDREVYDLININLFPFLERLEGDVQRLETILQEEARNPEKIKLFLKQVAPLFSRLYENIGQLHYDAQGIIVALEKEVEEKEDYYFYSKWLFIFVIFMLLGRSRYLFIRHARDNIERLKQAWQALEIAKDHAEEANKSKSQFLSNMSHELRTPLNAIIGFSQLLAMETLAKEQKQPVEQIHKSALHLLEMVNQVLDLAKIESGKLEIESEPFLLHSLLQDTAKMLEGVMQEKGILFHFQQDENLPDQVKGDSVRLRQVLINLLGNAIKFTKEEGAISLSVSVSRTKDLIYFEVADTGIGMTPETLKKLFNAFAQADISTTKQYGGTGLGLSLSKELVELMGGKIGVHSVYGEGSKFWFTLPLPSVQDVTSEMLEIEANSLAFDLTQIKVLLVEDNPINQLVAKKMLSKMGVQISVANHGQEALDLLAKSRFDLVLLDAQMPILDGYETIKRIRKKEQMEGLGKHLLVVGLSANALNEDRDKALALGMDDYLTKPINFSELQQKITHLFHLPS
jgi:signal transduction histidine kinase/CheY-like chemotaxis protein